MTVCCSCSTSPACQFVVSSLQCTILLVVTCTFHLVSLYKVIYHTSLIAQAHSTFHILPVIRLHLVVSSWNNLPDSVKVYRILCLMLAKPAPVPDSFAFFYGPRLADLK